MGLRDLVLAIVFYGALPLIPFRPFLGLVVFSWLAYLRPQDLSWVFGSARFSQYAAIATLLGMCLGFVLPRLVPRERWATLKLPTVWLLAMCGWLLLCSQTAVDPQVSADRAEGFVKVILIAVLTTGLVRTRLRFRLMIMVIALSLGALGLKFALYGAIRGGSVFTTGPGGFMVDNNAFALCLNMALPLLAGIAFVEERKSVRLLALVLACGSTLTIVFTLSRGGLLTLAAVGTGLIWMSEKRLLTISIVVLAAGGFFVFAGESFQQSYFQRAGTIARYDQDESAMGRIEEWGTARRISKDYPVFGVGPGNLYVVYSSYSDRPQVKVTHNSFLQLLVDTGYPGMTLLVGLLVISCYRLQRLRKRCWGDRFVRTYARMLQISVVAYIIGASLLDMAYLDLIYHLVALGVCLEVVAQESHTSVPESAVSGDAGKPWYLVASSRSPAT